MKKSKFTEEQIAFALRQVEAGTPVEQACRKLGVSEATFYRWKKQFGGMGIAECGGSKQLEEENRKLKQLVADLSLDKKMLQDVLAKKVLTPARRRDVVARLRAAYGASERRTCAAPAFPRASQRYASRRDPQDALRVRLRDLAGARFRYGYRRLHVLLRREGWEINHKRVYRLYAEEGLAMRRGRTRVGTPALSPRRAAGRRGGQPGLGDGLHERRPLGWPEVPRPDGRRHLHPRGPGRPGRRPVHRRRGRPRPGGARRRAGRARRASGWTTARSSSAGRWTCGPTSTA